MAPASAQTRGALRTYISLLAPAASWDELLEMRFRLPHGGMAKRLFPCGRSAGLVEAIQRLGGRSDVYVGCALRRGASGSKGSVSRAWVTWVDCDSADSVDRLSRFRLPPSLVIQSGGRGGRHAYWALESPLAVDELEDANARLAAALHADPGCIDAGRILRPPGSLNFKYRPPAAVEIEKLDLSRRYLADELTRGLAQPLATRAPRGNCEPRRHRDDPLLEIEPDRYVSALLGVVVPRSRKVPCPFHADEHPSLHVYAEAARGWFCFSCRRGGSVYDLAAALWDEPTRGPGFWSLQRQLMDRLGVEPRPTGVDRDR